MAQTRIHRRFAWQACHLWHTFVLRGRRGTYVTRWRAWSGFVACDAAALWWQAWHLVTSTFISRGRRGTNSHPPSFCVAGVALMALGGALGPDLSPVTPRPFAWQAWHLVTSTFISRGRRGTNSHPTWQAWHKLTSTLVLRGRRGTYGIG